MKKYFFIVNPNSGKKKSEELIPKIEDYLTSKKVDYEILLTERADHATDLVNERKHISDAVFVAVGGDGSINEIAKALVNHQSTLGIIPIGSGNGLARHLNISFDMEKALETIINGVEIKMDAGILNGQHFFVTAGIGFDAEVAHNFSQRNTRGLLGYVKETLKLYPLYSPSLYQITADNQLKKRKAFSVTIANCSQYGNDAVIAHQASVIDGKLDLCVIKSYPKLFGPQLGLSLFMNNLHDSRFYRTVQAETIEIEGDKNTAQCYVHIDGESRVMNYPIRVEVIKGAVNIMVPNERKI